MLDLKIIKNLKGEYQKIRDTIIPFKYGDNKDLIKFNNLLEPFYKTKLILNDLNYMLDWNKIIDNCLEKN